uniref:Ycf36 n=1 Tax=Crouania attenuata TaxID=42002 RepID=A0A4D6WQ28_9FLOR|nr:hypothetical protein [Crouania attenuata]
MSKLKKQCPVPFDQQPLNEYFELKNSWLFSSSINELNIYIVFIIRLFVILFILIFIFLSMFSNLNLFKIVISDLLIVQLSLIFLCIRLYLGWSYVIKRLLSATIFYEESGWYDGQMWIKTSDILMQDRLIALYQVNPSIKRVKYTFFVCLVNLCMLCLLFYIS